VFLAPLLQSTERPTPRQAIPIREEEAAQVERLRFVLSSNLQPFLRIRPLVTDRGSASALGSSKERDTKENVMKKGLAKRLVLSKETLRSLDSPSAVVGGVVTTGCRSRNYTNCTICPSVGGTCSDCNTCVGCAPYSEFCTL